MTMKTFCTIGSVASIALEFVLSHGQAHAQAAGCMVVEVIAEDQEMFRQKLAPALEKRGKEKIPKHPAQQGTMDDAGTRHSVREVAFASGQRLADYCDFKISAGHGIARACLNRSTACSTTPSLSRFAGRRYPSSTSFATTSEEATGLRN